MTSVGCKVPLITDWLGQNKTQSEIGLHEHNDKLNEVKWDGNSVWLSYNTHILPIFYTWFSSSKLTQKKLCGTYTTHYINPIISHVDCVWWEYPDPHHHLVPCWLLLSDRIDQNSFTAAEAFTHCWTPFTSTLVSIEAVGITNKQWQWVATWPPLVIAWWREEIEPAGHSLPLVPAIVPYTADV